MGALLVVLGLMFGLMAARLVVLQVVEFPQYAALAAEYRQREIPFPADRGVIYDRDGDPLAVSVDLASVFADPSQVTNVSRAARKLAPVLEMKEKVISKALRGTFPGDRWEPIARQVEDSVARKVEKLDLPGVSIQLEPKRIYPGGKLGAHVLGFVNDYGDALGGIELQYDDILKGKPGKMVLEQDPSGRALPQAAFTYQAPTPGRSLFLTLDKEIQYFTEQVLSEAVREYSADAATAIVMRVRTGEILAMANVPTFDPNSFSDFDDDARRNRAVTDNYEPGSSFKILTMAASLQEKLVTPNTMYSVPDKITVSDRTINDSHTHAETMMSVTDILVESSNVGTIKIGLQLGKDRLIEWIDRFGFGSETGLDFPGEADGIVIDPDSWYGSTISQIPLGQGIAVTPIQMVAAYGAIANDGVWVEPKLVHSAQVAGDDPVRAAEPARHRVMKRRIAGQMMEILTQVVERGTGVEARVPGYRVAGKTGTAQKPLPTGGYGASYIASFAGIAPSRRPEIVILVTFDEPNPIWGGSTSAPVFKRIAEFSLRHLGIAPDTDAESSRDEIEEDTGEPVVHD